MHELDYVYALGTNLGVGKTDKERDTPRHLFFTRRLRTVIIPIGFNIMKMVKKPSIRFYCPGCERENFRSLTGVRNHFLKKRHTLQCPVCEKTFQDEMAIIQHYQTYYAKSASPDIPNAVHPISSPSVLPSSAVVTPVAQSISVHAVASEEPPKPSEQGLEITDSLLASMPVLNITEGPIPGKEPRIYPLSNSRLIFISTKALPGIAYATAAYPTDIHLLEQDLILRYLRSRCHSWKRLDTEGYIIGPTTVRNKKRPCKGSIPTYHFRETPRMGIQAAGTACAIAIDCEMVGVRNGRQTLAFLSAINVLTGEVLISRYVNPSEEVLDWRYKFTGVTQAIMTSAVACGAAFKSWREARDKLWEFMDDSTVLVGHSLHYDLEVLGISHAKVVDYAILTAETVYPSIPSTKPLTRYWALKTLAKDLLGLNIQTGNCGHSALEDAYAARNVVIWCIRNPEDLKAWAEKTQLQEEHRLAHNRQRYGKGKSKGKFPASQSTPRWEHNTALYGDSDDIRWSDFAEDLDWPEGYDPWSD
ncbi:Polynucleotidyl transferase, ribonuclease H fold [Penicillium camemberti]|uniref:Polynucleotidyl transferase, ribonuclease H fold n=1 Tax=Penicillium camemberti (strain FM 013) TaxID=1429867 RepID=A0A0G4PQH6_PENC3|nr:Polynucleotidyl transferase, ribonuclease H fold [Penicillium camemberti]